MGEQGHPLTTSRIHSWLEILMLSALPRSILRAILPKELRSASRGRMV